MKIYTVLHFELECGNSTRYIEDTERYIEDTDEIPPPRIRDNEKTKD